MGETVGAQLRAARKFDRLTLREVAEKVGVGVPHLSKVENDQENPSDDLLYKLAEVYDLSGDLLVLFAGRVPPRFVAALVADPVRALDLLSTLRPSTPAVLEVDHTLTDAEFEAYVEAAGFDPHTAGAGGGLNVPSNFTDSPTPTPTPAPDHVGGATLLLGLWVPGADCHPDPDVIADVLTRTINEDRHRSEYLTRLGDIEVSAVPSPQWLTAESLARLRSQLAGPSPAGTPETVRHGRTSDRRSR